MTALGFGFVERPLFAESAATCDAKVVARVRREAEQKVRAGALADAETLLRPFVDACLYSTQDVGTEQLPNLDFYWVRSDLSFVLYRLGKYRDCMSLLAPLTYPGPPDGLSGNGLDDDKVAKAIEHNEKLCEDAVTRAYSKLSEKSCSSQQAKDDRTEIGLPAELSEKGRLRCLILEDSKSASDLRRELDAGRDPDSKKFCPRVYVTTANNQRTLLAVREGALANTSHCCNVDSLAVGLVDKQRIVRVRGQGRDCSGGTAQSIIDDIYFWTGNQLTLTKSFTRSPH